MDLDQERGDLNALVREAHEATKDLRQVLRDIDQRIEIAEQTKLALAETIASAIQADLSDFMAAEAAKQISLLQEATAIAIAKAEAGVYKRFDEIADILIGENQANNLVTEARKIRAFMDQRGVSFGSGS